MDQENWNAASPPRKEKNEKGIALVLVLLIVTLLYIIVAELVTTSEFDRMTAENLSIETMEGQALKVGLSKVLEDLAGDTDQGGSGGGTGGAGAAALGNLGGAGAGGAPGAEEDEGDPGDSSRDTWFKPYVVFEDDRLTVYAFVEDENRKFNLLTLLSPDSEFRTQSKKRLIRLLDELWEEAEFDLSRSEAESWVESMEQWMRGESRNDDLPKPPLQGKFELDKSEVIPPFSLRELMLAGRIPKEAFPDRIVGRTLFPGLDAVLTVHSSLRRTPLPQGPGEGNSGAPSGGTGAGDNRTGTGASGTGQNAGGGKDGEESLGPGVRINLNTAPRAVLQCLASTAEIPGSVIESILRFRNEIEEKEQKAGEDDELLEDKAPKYKIFTSVEDLDLVEDWKLLPENEALDRFKALLSTRSNVFSIHLAAVFKRDEEGKAFQITRASSVWVRDDQGEEGKMYPLIPLHRVQGLRVFQVDFPEEQEENPEVTEDEEFAAEQNAWNPFRLDFYDPKKRNEFR
jgi:uncharacterized membrane protein YgcG